MKSWGKQLDLICEMIVNHFKIAFPHIFGTNEGNDQIDTELIYYRFVATLTPKPAQTIPAKDNSVRLWCDNIGIPFYPDLASSRILIDSSN